MSKLFILLKYNFINSFNINKIFKKKNNERLSLIFTILVGLVGILIFFLFGLYMYFYGKMFVESGKSDGVLLLGVFFGSLIIAISSVSKTYSYLFSSKDFDLLMSLPIDTKTIFMSKVINLLIINYVMFSYFYLPAIIVYSMFEVTNFLYWFLAILSFFIIPLPIVSIFGFLSCQLGKIKLNEKIKRMLTILLSILLVVVIMIVTMNLNSETGDENIFFNDMYNSLKKLYYFGYIIVLGIKGSVNWFLFFVVLSLILFICFFIYANKNYLIINSNEKDKNIKNKKNAKEEQILSPRLALIKKEIRSYFGNPIYVVNTLIGPILSIIFIFFLYSQSKAEYLKVGEKLIEMRMILPPLSLFLIVFSVSITSTTSSSISLEGKNMWILKSLPVREKDIFNAKIFVNLLITIPFIIVDNIIINFKIDLSFIESVFMFLIPISIVDLVSNIGLYINLRFPKLDYSQPAQVVKQSLSVLVTMVVTTILIMILIFVAIFVYLISNNIILSYLLLFLICELLVIIIKIVINSNGKKLFNKIEH